MLAIELEVKLLHLTLILFFGSWGAIAVISWWLLLFLFPPMFVRLPVSQRTSSCSSFSVIVILIGGANITLLWVSYLLCLLAICHLWGSVWILFLISLRLFVFIYFWCLIVFTYSEFYRLAEKWSSFCICVLWSVDLFNTVPFLYFSLLFFIY